MRVRYIYSACVVIETLDATVCCDPWFTPGIYDGAWCQYPPLPRDPVDVIGPVDVIYVSHIHPDHYDPNFLRRYLARYPTAILMIGETDPPHLLAKMKLDGFRPSVITDWARGETRLRIIPNHAREQDNIDTALVVRWREQSVVNMNDNPVDPRQTFRIKLFLEGRRPTLALLPYSGAGPYPQTFDFDSPDALALATAAKRREFLDLYAQYVDLLQPERAMPFAGKYYLTGPLARLNRHRGLADAVEVLALPCGDISVVLADGGEATLDLASLSPSAVRTVPYRTEDIDAYIKALPFAGYDYEREIRPLDRPLPIVPLLRVALERARRNYVIEDPYWFGIRPRGWATYAVFNVAGPGGIEVRGSVADLEPRCEILIDERYLFGLLTRMYHWNNAAVGSQYRCRRVPDVFRRDVFGFLDHLQV